MLRIAPIVPRPDAGEQESMTDYQELMLVDAGPGHVFRLISDVDRWQYLMPHVRSVETARPAIWQITVVWRWLPVAVAVSSMSDSAARMAEFRVAMWPRVWVAVRWVVDSGPDDSASVRVNAEVARAPLFIRRLIRRAVAELCRDSLEMVRLLAESDRIAHKGIEV